VLKVEGSDDLRFGAYKKYKSPPRPKMEIVETDDIGEKTKINDNGSVIYLSTLDGLRARLGLNPLREAGVDLTAALTGDREGRGRKDDQPDMEMKADIVDLDVLQGEAWQGVRDRASNEKYFERAENIVMVG